MADIETVNHTVVGKIGTGKTSMIAEIIAARSWDQIFIFDYCGEFREFAIDGYCYVAHTGFKDFCESLWESSREGVETLLVLDEVAIYGKNNYLVEHIYRLARHKQINIVAASQRFYILPMMVRSQTHIYHVHQLTEIRDLEFLDQTVGKEIRAVIQGLGRFQYINLTL